MATLPRFSKTCSGVNIESFSKLFNIVVIPQFLSLLFLIQINQFYILVTAVYDNVPGLIKLSPDKFLPEN